ncbi:lymphotactin [Sigmodon hispidus]
MSGIIVLVPQLLIFDTCKGSVLTNGGNKRAPEDLIHTVLAQFSKTSAMRLLLLTFLGLCCLIPCAVEGVGTETIEESFCVSLTTQRLPVHRIRTYTIREGMVKAVIFVTKRGIKICADPQAKWVKAAIKSVDGRSRSRKNMTEMSPTPAQRSISPTMTLSG